MYITTTVVEPPLESVVISCEKDACVSLSEPIFNYGTAKEMLVLRNDEDEWQSLLVFNVAAIDETTISNLKRAKLTITLSAPASRNITLALNFHANTDWSETGVTYANAPAIYKQYKTVSIKEGDTNVVFDVLDLMQENIEYTSYGFTITEISDTEQTNPIYLRTRESNQPPVLIYEYKTFPDNADTGNLNSSIIVAAKTSYDLDTIVKLRTGISYYDLNTIVNVKGYKDTSDIDSSIIVSDKDIIDLIDTSIKINEYDGFKEIDDTITVRRTDSIDIDSMLNIEQKNGLIDIDSSAIINRTLSASLDSSIKVKEYTLYNELDSSITVCQTSPFDLDSKVKVKEYNNYADIDSSANVAAAYTTTIDTVISISFDNSRKDIDTSIRVRDKFYLDSSAKVIAKDFADIDSKIKAVPRYYKDLDCILVVGNETRKPYAFIM
jgi:hypothetical protein